MKILVGSKNPGKIKAAELAFNDFFNDVEVEGISSPSNVPDQPIDLDIYKGAKNRVDNLMTFARENNIDADYFTSVESGMTNLLGKWMITNVAVIKDISGKESWGTSASFPVPDKYVEEIKEKSLGTVMDEIFGEKDLHNRTGGIGLLTNDVITRIDLSKQAFDMSLTQFINNNWNDFD